MNNQSWVLAVDFGTTNTVAAVADVGDRPRILQVDGGPTMTSAVYLDTTIEPANLLTGRAAEGSALVDPSCYEPNPKRAIEHGTVFLGGRVIDVLDAVSAVLERVFAEAAHQHGNTAPAVLVLTHPALWRGQRLQRLEQAAARASALRPGWPAPVLLAEPVAAAQHAVGARNLAAVTRIAVLDLGGGTCDVAVIDRDNARFTLAGTPAGIDPLGGEDFDARLTADVLEQLGNPDLVLRLAAPESPADRVAAFDLRRSVRTAKETLSQASHAYVRVPIVPGVLPEGASTQVTVARFESLVAGDETRPGLSTAATLVRDAMMAAPPGPGIGGVFLVGGSSRIPLLSRLVTASTGQHPAAHGDPATAVAEGAALYALSLASPGSAFPVSGASFPVSSGSPYPVSGGAQSPVSGFPASGVPVSGGTAGYQAPTSGPAYTPPAQPAQPAYQPPPPPYQPPVPPPPAPYPRPQPATPYLPPNPPVVIRTTNSTAIIALVLAIVFPPAGIVAGHMAKKQIATRHEDGGGIATAALVIGYAYTGLLLLFCFIGVIGSLASSSS